MIDNKIISLFDEYIDAFTRYDIKAAESCYLIPCTLTTPDKIVVINNRDDFSLEFKNIFSQLKSANTKGIKATQASFQELTTNMVLVCIDWAFSDVDNEVFADFSAFYYL